MRLRYLENVFRGSEDIRPHLPDESIMFDDVNEGFINMMRSGAARGCFKKWLEISGISLRSQQSDLAFGTMMIFGCWCV